jgi:diacylglycerol kinase
MTRLAKDAASLTVLAGLLWMITAWSIVLGA